MSHTYPTHLKYTKEHEWIEMNGDIATIGITAFAQESLGDLVYVELPEVGRKISSGDDFAVVESVKAASEVYSPVSGEVVEVNTDLADSPQSINESPYDDGWLVKVRISDASELDDTMDAASYTTFVEEQA